MFKKNYLTKEVAWKLMNIKTLTYAKQIFIKPRFLMPFQKFPANTYYHTIDKALYRKKIQLQRYLVF